MEGGIAEAVKVAKLSHDDLVEIVEKAIEDSIEEEKKRNLEAEIPTELIRDHDIYTLMTNPAIYPKNSELSKKVAGIYVGFILEQAMKEAVKKAPFQVMKDGILAALRNSPLINTDSPMLGDTSILLRKRLGDYLAKQEYPDKDESMIYTLRRGS